MLLVLTNSGDATADYLCGRLASAGVDLARLDTDTCAHNMQVLFADASPRLRLSGQTIAASDVQAIWLRRPRAIQVSGSADPVERAHVSNEWGEALEGFLAHIPPDRWMNHPTSNVLASHKLEQLTRAKRVGLTVPETLVTQERIELTEFWKRHDGHIIVKPIASGYLERPDGSTASIYTNRVGAEYLDSAALRSCPTLFQEEIEKVYDVRLTVVDQRVVAVSLRNEAPGDVDIRRRNMQDVVYKLIDTPVEVAARVLQLVSSYGLRFAAIDFGVLRSGEWVFFEVNPNGQWAWLDLAGAAEIWKCFLEGFR